MRCFEGEAGAHHKDEDHHSAGGCGQCRGADRAHQILQAGCSAECGASLPRISPLWTPAWQRGYTISIRANYEAENTEDPQWRAVYEERCKRLGFTAYFDYSWQWAYQEKFEKAGLTALLGTGFDPGVTSVFVAYAQKHYFDEIHTINILDCNGGDHGYPFATNFNPEINLREVSAPGSYWENGKWVEIPGDEHQAGIQFRRSGTKRHVPASPRGDRGSGKEPSGVKRIRFFMTFGQSYLTHMKCLENVGMLSTVPVDFNGQQIVPSSS